MATSLETLELTINGNAVSAKAGIDILIQSLRDLSKEISAPLKGLQALNAELQKAKKNSSFSFSHIFSKGAYGKAQSNANSAAAPVPTPASPSRSPSSSPYTPLGAAAPGGTTAPGSGNSLGHLKGEVKEVSKGLTELMDKVSRVAQTMVLRMAIKQMIKSFQEAWKAAYNFSKAMGGSFAKAVDSTKGALKNIATTIVTTFAPVMQVVSAVVNVAAQGVQYLCNALQELMKWLGMSSELFGQNAETVASYGNTANNTSKDIIAGFDELNVLDSSSSGGGGGSGSNSNIPAKIQEQLDQVKIIVGEALLAVGLILAFSGHSAIGLSLAAVGAAAIAGTIKEKWGTMSDKVKQEIVTIMAIAGGAFLALGAILAFSGVKTGLGIALIAAGAVNMATAASLSWNLSEDIKKQISIITMAVGAASIAVGAILAFSGAKVALGIALMAAGVASMGSGTALSWNLSEDIKRQIVTITSILGAGLMVVGAVLAFSGAATSLGIGMMIAGAASMASAVALSWNMSEDIKRQVALITSIVGMSLLAIGAVLAFSGGATGLGIGMMIAGAASLAASVALTWNLSDKVKKEISTLATVVGGALLVVGAILAFSGAATPLGIGLMVAGGVSLGAAVALNWDELKNKITTTFKNVKDKLEEYWGKIKKAIGDAWDKYMSWTGVSWSDIQSAWNSIKTNLSAAWDKVKNSVSDAWKKAEDWIKTKWEQFGGWEGIKSKICGLWNTIGKAVEDAWTKVKTWIGAKWDDLRIAWNNIKDNLSLVWNVVRDRVKEAWDKFVEWTKAKWSDIQYAWNNIKTGLTNVWDNVKTSVYNAWLYVSYWFSQKWDSIKLAWENIRKGLAEKWDNIKSAVSDAWDMFQNWASAKWSDISTGWTEIKKKVSEVWTGIGSWVTNAYIEVKKVFETSWDKFRLNWDTINTNLSGVWTNIRDTVNNCFAWISKVFNTAWNNFQTNWDKINENLSGVWANIQLFVHNAWLEVSEWWNTNIVSNIENAWKGVVKWFEDNITTPISDAWNNLINTVKGWINTVIEAFNKLGTFTIPKIALPIPEGFLQDIFGKEIVITSRQDVTLWHINPIPVDEHAQGAYEMPKGQLFIANESGPELVGQMNNHTTVANQEQIIEGIRRGVRDANYEQNELLRRQNELLLGILEKRTDVHIGASSALGRTVKQSLEMYSTATGV